MITQNYLIFMSRKIRGSVRRYVKRKKMKEL